MLRKIQSNLNSAYICPQSASKKAQSLISQESELLKNAEHQARRDKDRRCGRDRREARQNIILDLRNPYARRKTGRRIQEALSHLKTLDIYV